MPGSMPDGKKYVKEFFQEKEIHRVLDVGAGSGNYYDLFNSRGEYEGWGPVKDGIEWVTVEVFEPYIESFNLTSKYNKIYIGDITEAHWDELGQFDLTILGDVIEHMGEISARKVIRECVGHSKWIVISLPIVEFLQGQVYGNVYEAHVEQYTSESIRALLKDYKIVGVQESEVIGVYIIENEKLSRSI